MASNEAAIDPVLNSLGSLGTFACVQCAFFMVGYLNDAYQIFSYVFTSQDVDFACAAFNLTNGTDMEHPWPRATSVEYGKCEISVFNNDTGQEDLTTYPCLYGVQYSKPRNFSIISDFDLVCENGGKAELSQTLLSMGAGLGGFVFPGLSDLYGRKRIFMLSTSLGLVNFLVTGYASNLTILLICKFFSGMIANGVGLVAVTAGVEIFPTRQRALMSGFVSTLWWASCIASLGPVAYLLRGRSWRTLQMVLAAAPGLSFFLAFFLSEPVRWLVARGKIKEAEKVLRRAARWNGKDPDAIINLFRDLTLHSTTETKALNVEINSSNIQVYDCPPTDSKTEESCTTEDQQALIPQYGIQGEKTLGSEENCSKFKPKPEETCEKDAHQAFAHQQEKEGMESGRECNKVPMDKEKLGIFDLIKKPLLRKHLLLSWITWFSDSFMYFGLYLSSGTLAIPLYASFSLSAMAEGSSCLLMIFTLGRYGRKNTLVLFHFIGVIGLIASSVCLFYKDTPGLFMAGSIVSFVGKFGVSGAFNVEFLYTPEIFPTNIRNRALGVCSFGATLGSMAAPYCKVLADYGLWLPAAVFGGLCLLSLLTLLGLPESNGRELPQTLHDLEMWKHQPPPTINVQIIKPPSDTEKSPKN